MAGRSSVILVRSSSAVSVATAPEAVDPVRLLVGHEDADVGRRPHQGQLDGLHPLLAFQVDGQAGPGLQPAGPEVLLVGLGPPASWRGPRRRPAGRAQGSPPAGRPAGRSRRRPGSPTAPSRTPTAGPPARWATARPRVRRPAACGRGRGCRRRSRRAAGSCRRRRWRPAAASCGRGRRRPAPRRRRRSGARRCRSSTREPVPVLASQGQYSPAGVAAPGRGLRAGAPSSGSGANSGRSGGSSNGGGGGGRSGRAASQETSSVSSSKIGSPACVGCSTGGAGGPGASTGSSAGSAGWRGFAAGPGPGGTSGSSLVSCPGSPLRRPAATSAAAIPVESPTNSRSSSQRPRAVARSPAAGEVDDLVAQRVERSRDAGPDLAGPQHPAAVLRRDGYGGARDAGPLSGEQEVEQRGQVGDVGRTSGPGGRPSRAASTENPITRTEPLWSISTFSGTSRPCATPPSWAVAIAAATSETIHAARRGPTGPSLATRMSSEVPEPHSLTT